MAYKGSQIRVARKSARLSQEELADSIDVGQRTISRWENDRGAPDINELLRICKATETTISDFVDDTEGLIDGGVPAPTPTQGLLAEGDDYFGDKEVMDLVVRPDDVVQVGAGDGGFQVVDLDRDAITLRVFKQFIYDLLGFWPPDTMEALRIVGNSMKPTFRDGQLVLVDPVHKLGGMVNLRRYVIYIHDLRTNEWSPLAKRIIRRPGGGFRIVSDNRAYGEADMVLYPKEDGHLYDNETGQRIDLRVYGEVLWPRDQEEKDRVQSATNALETLISEGSIEVRRRAVQ